MACHNGAATIRRDGFVALEIREVRNISWEENVDGLQEGALCHCRVQSFNGSKRAFFLDADNGQANIREIDSALPDLRSVIKWLLPRGYSYRQGDIGIYRRESLPRMAQVVLARAYLEEYAPILHMRHRLEPLEACQFYRTTRKYFVRLESEARILHPEHAPVHMRVGSYEFIAARGQIISIENCARLGKPAFL